MSINILKRKRIIKSAKDINKMLSLIDYYGLTPIKLGIGQKYKSIETWEVANKKKVYLSQYMIIELKDTKLEITTRYYDYGVPCTYIFDLNNEDIFKQSGIDCFKELCKAHKIPKATEYNYNLLNKWYNTEAGKYTCSAKPILDYNKKFEKQILTDCYEYDLNSAYATTLLKYIPDLEKPIIANYPDQLKVNKNEIGFLIDDELSLVKHGYKADIKFPLIETPKKLKYFLIRWYNKKKAASGNERLKAKAMLNLPIGYCQRYNPFLRSYVVNSCNEAIKNIIDENTLFWNTDAIFSKVRRPELEIGNEIGQFKEIKCDKLVYVGNIYQINDEDPTYRGISKSWFKAFEKKYGRKYDLLKDYDKQVSRINYYNLNWETLQLEINEIWQEKN